MIPEEKFLFLSNDLNFYKDYLANCSWGKIQNDQDDRLLHPFNLESYSDLYYKMQRLQPWEQMYASARFYRQKCADCDEYLFDINESVSANPNIRDKSWDFQINGTIFDLKSTAIFKDMSLAEVLTNPEHIIQRYYDKQSSGTRNGAQNRIFLIHHSNKINTEPNRIQDFNTNLLRCRFNEKKEIIRRFVEDFDNVRQHQKFNITYQGTKPLAYYLLIIENEDGTLTYKY